MQPFLTADLAGTGGAIREIPEDYEVEEISAYPPSGNGDHVFAWIEKRDLTTYEAIRRMAGALGVRPEDVGYAGLKDRHALTRQVLSFPRPVTEAACLALSIEGLKVLSAVRHEHKLRTGHLRGNLFRIRIRQLKVSPGEAVLRAEQVFAELGRPPGVPNWYGEQRFGRHGDNALRGRALVRGDKLAPPPRDGRERRLLVSAYQSELFNRFLCARMGDGLYARVIPGDLLTKVATGGVFETSDPRTDQERLEAGEIAPTGPMFGHAMRSPTPATEAWQREAALLAAEDLRPELFRRIKWAEGTRRPTGVSLAAPAICIEEDALVLSFGLPAGSYATSVAREVMKPEALMVDCRPA